MENSLEIEIKLRVRDAAHGLDLIRLAGCRLVRERTFEVNILFDTPDESLRKKGQLLRLREYGTGQVVTFKGKALAGRHKVREEIELLISNGNNFQKILERLGYLPGFRYEKFRTEFLAPSGEGKVVLDETPIGALLELEGPPEWIDATARAMGFSIADYITVSYGTLWEQDCRGRGVAPASMVFDREGA